MLIKAKVFAGSKKSAVIRKSEDTLEVRVKEEAERGLANKAVAFALASYFKISPERVRLIKGAKKRNKIFEIV